MSEGKMNVFARIKNFFVECKAEMKKIVWPTQKVVWKNTGIVLLMIFMMGVFVAILDTGLMELLGLVMSVSKNK